MNSKVNQILDILVVLIHEQTDEVIIYNELLNTYFIYTSNGELRVLDKKSVWNHVAEVHSLELKNTLISEEMLAKYFLTLHRIAEELMIIKANVKTGQLLLDYINKFSQKDIK